MLRSTTRFNALGFALSILSSFASTSFNLLTKKLMASSALDNFQIQYYVSCICLLFMFPVWVLVVVDFDAWDMWHHDAHDTIAAVSATLAPLVKPTVAALAALSIDPTMRPSPRFGDEQLDTPGAHRANFLEVSADMFVTSTLSAALPNAPLPDELTQSSLSSTSTQRQLLATANERIPTQSLSASASASASASTSASASASERAAAELGVEAREQTRNLRALVRLFLLWMRV
jgi:hypothetical protein